MRGGVPHQRDATIKRIVRAFRRARGVNGGETCFSLDIASILFSVPSFFSLVSLSPAAIAGKSQQEASGKTHRHHSVPRQVEGTDERCGDDLAGQICHNFATLLKNASRRSLRSLRTTLFSSLDLVSSHVIHFISNYLHDIYMRRQWRHVKSTETFHRYRTPLRMRCARSVKRFGRSSHTPMKTQGAFMSRHKKNRDAILLCTTAVRN